MDEALKDLVERAWEERDSIGPATKGPARQAVDAALAALDSGEARIAEKVGGEWTVRQWLKKAVLLSFRLNPMELISGGSGGGHWWDKVPSKFAGFDDTVNVTLGLPIVRTSVDHGTAYDIAGTGKANEANMLAAIELAAQMAANRERRLTEDSLSR